MVLLLADENFNDDILQGVRDYDASLVFLRVREAGLESQPDCRPRVGVRKWLCRRNSRRQDYDTFRQRTNSKRAALSGFTSRSGENAIPRGN